MNTTPTQPLSTATLRQPVLFLSHGAPTFALEPGRLGQELTALAGELPRPRAILVMSPHWSTVVLTIQTHPAPPTVHDFGGFDPALYELTYPAPGAPDIASEVMAVVQQAGFRVCSDDLAGRDHGTWVPLRHLFPQADIPVIQLSLPARTHAAELLQLGEALRHLRDTGILIVASGAMTHNLYEITRRGPVPDYVRRFADWISQHVHAGDVSSLLAYREQAPAARRAHPTEEHLLPLFLALGAAGAPPWPVRRLGEETCYGVIAMDSFVFGLNDGMSTT